MHFRITRYKNIFFTAMANFQLRAHTCIYFNLSDLIILYFFIQQCEEILFEEFIKPKNNFHDIFHLSLICLYSNISEIIAMPPCIFRCIIFLMMHRVQRNACC